MSEVNITRSFLDPPEELLELDELLLEELELEELELELDELEELLEELPTSEQFPVEMPAAEKVTESMFAKPSEESAANSMVFCPAFRNTLMDSDCQVVQAPVGFKLTVLLPPAPPLTLTLAPRADVAPLA